MSENFLNFLTTSVIILSCGTTINGSSCYCMESKILSQQDQELSQKLLTELSKMDANIKDELKRKQIIVDKNGQPIENESFFIQDFLRSYQITWNNALNKVLKSIVVPKEIIEQFNRCMTSCMQLGNQIGDSLKDLMSMPYNVYFIRQNFSFIQFTTPYYETDLNNNDDTVLRDISFAQLITVLNNIMADTGETFNIDNISSIKMIKLQHFFYYLSNKIQLISINYMQNIKEYIEEYIKKSINNNTMDAKEIAQKIIAPTIVCCETVLSIAYNLKEYLSSISNNYDFANTQRVLATKINENEYLTSSIKNLAEVTNELQQIQKDYNNKNSNNIKKENNNPLPNNIVLKPSNDINNSEQIENSNLTNEVLSDVIEPLNSSESSEVSSESGEDSNSSELSENSNLTSEGSSELSGNSNSNELSENSNLTSEDSSELSGNSNSNELSEINNSIKQDEDNNIND